MNEQMQRHTAKGEAAIRRAHDEVLRLTESAEACIELFEHVGLPLVALEVRADARATFRAGFADPQFRLQFALWTYQAALRLYEEGAFD
jgi:hypothetical protein